MWTDSRSGQEFSDMPCPTLYVTNGVERVEIVKGPSSLIYGSNAMGGSVNIITRRHLQDGFTGRAHAEFGSFTTQKFGLTTGYRKGKFGVTVAGALDRSNGYREKQRVLECQRVHTVSV